jgi:hypothetical protein
MNAAQERKTREAREVLRALGLPNEQQNDRSAWTLLALLALKPTTPWAKATAPLMGITPIMDFIKNVYSHDYKPNTRETIRRQTVHQFLDAGLIMANPDAPGRAVNSPNNVYQVEAKALELLRTFRSPTWERNLAGYIAEVGTLAKRYAQARAAARIPVILPDGYVLKLTPGGQNELV